MIRFRANRFWFSHAAVVMIFVLVAACGKDQYEIEIERFYFENINGSVSIVSLNLDTTVTFEQARPWLEKKLERAKERLKATYEEQYIAARSATKPDPNQIAVLKAKLDSANAGLYSPNNHEIKAFSAFITEKPYFEQLTLDYKVWVQGEVRRQIFIRKVSASDTTLNVTEKGISEYLKY
jgi:hypothetical protein